MRPVPSGSHEPHAPRSAFDLPLPGRHDQLEPIRRRSPVGHAQRGSWERDRSAPWAPAGSYGKRWGPEPFRACPFPDSVAGPMRSRIAVLCVAMMMLAACGARAATAPGPTRVSGATPWPGGCGVKGTQTPSSEAEPWLAADPTDPRRLIAVYQQDRFPVDGGALGNLAAVSDDGGATFTTVAFPGLTRCTGGARERASDPWVSFGPDGTAYAAHLTFDENEALGAAGLAGPTQLASSTSTDGGRTWSAPSRIVDENLYDDREALTADPLHPGRAYVVWVRRLGAFGENGAEQLSYTIDGGRTWSAPRTIYTPQPLHLPDPILLDVLPDGTLLNTFLVIDVRSQVQSEPVPYDMFSMRSPDGGRSWSAPVKIGTTPSTEPSDPDTGAPIRSLPIIATALGRSGVVYGAWNEIDSSSQSRIRIARSPDGGRSWGAPRTVAAPAGQAFLPAVAVAPDGTVGVTYDDTRDDRRGDGELTTDVWLSISHDGGRTFAERHLAGPFDALTASETSSTGVAGHFLGDYQALVPLRSSFALAFAAARPLASTGPSDIFLARASTVAPPAPGLSKRLSLVVSPRRVHAGHRTRLRFVARRGTARARAVRIRVAGHLLHTDRHGRASVVVRPRRAGRIRSHASRRGLRSADAYVTVTSARGARGAVAAIESD